MDDTSRRDEARRPRATDLGVVELISGKAGRGRKHGASILTSEVLQLSNPEINKGLRHDAVGAEGRKWCRSRQEADRRTDVRKRLSQKMHVLTQRCQCERTTGETPRQASRYAVMNNEHGTDTAQQDTEAEAADQKATHPTA